MEDSEKLIEVNEQVPSFTADWPYLPFVPLTDVYSYLSRRDQCSMTQVCKNWSKGFSSPYLWRRFEFDLPEDELTEHPWYLMKYVEDNSDVMKHARILYSLHTDYKEPIELWLKQFFPLMDILTRKSQINSVEFERFGDLSNFVKEPIYKNVCRVISDFLASQRNLNKLCFNYFYSQYQDWMNLLKKVFENGRKCLRHVVMLEVFIDSQPDEQNQEQILPTLLGLEKLETLSIDYALIFRKDAEPSVVLEILKNYKKKLTLKILLYLISFRGYKRLELKQWRDLKKANKLLKLDVHIIAESLYIKEDYYVIVEHMPVTNIRFIINEYSELDDIVGFLKHPLICITYEHLLSCELEFEVSGTVFPEALSQFVNSCPKLNEVVMKLKYPVNDLNVLLKSLAPKPPISLKSFTLIISEIGSEENKLLLKELLSNFEQILKLNVKLYL